VQRSLSDRIDRVALHPIFGPLIFLVVMALVFQAVFSWATPMMDVLGMGFAWLGSLLASWLPESPWRGLLIDGALTGVGAVVVFIPQILLLFLFISILEDSGYLARAAFLVDRLMVRSGLSGKSFIPLLSSFACAIPGIMATRTIKNERDRLATIMVAPLMTCSARLPVYALLIGAFIPNRTWWGLKLPGVVLFALYLLGMLGAVVVAKVMRATVLKGPRSMLVLELPDYHMPNWRNIAIGLWTRVKLFLRRAGKIILTASIILWFLCSYPRHEKHLAEMRQSGASEAVLKTEIIENSFAGKIGKFIEPVIRPLGYDWKVGIGLLASLAAREVFVSTMATIYSVEDDTADADSLRSALQSDRNPRTGKALFSVAMVCGLLVFFSFAMQCVSTVAVIRRETNSWRWPLFALLYTYVLAYVLAFTTFQILNFWL
jgi:ferrous iron transport protein B